MSSDAKTSPDQWFAHNYFVSFIDLLGQRDALKDQSLLPNFNTEEDEKQFIDAIKDSIGAIFRLQERSEAMLREGQHHAPESPLRVSLSPEQKSLWDEMLRSRVTTQRWSDGLVSFACLGDQDVKCPLNGVFNIFATAGSLCFMGLAARSPIRGAIDVGWGVEVHPGELYGAAVARAYELESSCAQYPRIVVSSRAVRFLEAHKNNQQADVFSAANRTLADLCLTMLAQDVDGVWILHYLGESFRNAVTYLYHNELYSHSRQFIQEQLNLHQKTANSKLAFRYSHLLLYFDAHNPDEEEH